MVLSGNGSEGDLIETIVVGVDGSEGAAQALEFAIREAALRGARLRLVCAWEVPPAVLASVVAGGEFYEEFKDNAVTVVCEAAARVAELRPSVQYEERVVEGQAGNVLLEESRGVAMLVVGNRGHGAFRELLLGSVSRQVVQHARCPVVVVPAAQG
jgi:nucleotide-binding universal stress UspA family protein